MAAEVERAVLRSSCTDGMGAPQSAIRETAVEGWNQNCASVRKGLNSMIFEIRWGSTRLYSHDASGCPMYAVAFRYNL
jgi:hypothetical protein